MLVSFEVTNYGPFSETVGISTQADNSKKEFLEENTFFDGGKRYNYVSYIYGSTTSVRDLQRRSIFNILTTTILLNTATKPLGAFRRELSAVS